MLDHSSTAPRMHVLAAHVGGADLVVQHACAGPPDVALHALEPMGALGHVPVLLCELRASGPTPPRPRSPR
eukprot:3362691-Heterocapsa_arctica.AAC.1